MKPATNSADEQALGLAREVPIERHQPGRRLGWPCGSVGRLQRSFEQAEHGASQCVARDEDAARGPFSHGFDADEG